MKKEKKDMGRAKTIIRIAIILILIIVIALLGMVIYKIKFKGDDSANSSLNGSKMNFDGIPSETLVAAYGVTNIKTESEVFPIEELAAGLEVEEVLISSGETINGESVILKFTEASVAEAREELEKTLRSADLAYRAGKIEYDQAKISAAYTYESTVLSGKHAETVYEETISGLEESVERAREEYEDVQEEIAEYEEALANNTYQINLEKAQNEYDENYDVLVYYMGEWDIKWSEVTGQGGVQGDATRMQYVNVLRELYGVLESNAKDLEEAEQEYEDKVTNVSFSLQTLQLSLPALSEAYANAQESYERSLIQAKLTKETALTEAELAEKNYKINLEKAESDYEALKDAMETAKENLEIFESRMGTGYYYPEKEGSILRVSARAGREVTSGSTIFTVRNSEEMTVNVSVDQADIAKLQIGDKAMVVSEEAGTYQGVVSGINPISSSGSRSSVTYSVTVTLTGNTGQLSSNETVSVYFTVGGSDD